MAIIRAPSRPATAEMRPICSALINGWSLIAPRGGLPPHPLAADDADFGALGAVNRLAHDIGSKARQVGLNPILQHDPLRHRDTGTLEDPILLALRQGGVAADLRR